MPVEDSATLATSCPVAMKRAARAFALCGPLLTLPAIKVPRLETFI